MRTEPGARAAAALVAAAAMSTALAAPAHAQSLRDLLGRGETANVRTGAALAAGRYVAAHGQSFVLAPSNGALLFRFEGSAEIWVLKPSSGPRGDQIYRDDTGRAVVRATRLGGLTLFTPERPSGAPAALEQSGEARLTMRPVRSGALLQLLAQASGRVSKAARRLVTFNAPDVPAGAEPIFADSAQVTAEAMVDVAAAEDGRRRLARLRQVRLVKGRQPSARVGAGALEVSINPEMGLAGRPSSRMVTEALLAAR